MTLDPGGAFVHRALTLPIDIVLDAWLARYDVKPVPLPRDILDYGSTDPLLNNMAQIAYRMCYRNNLTDLFEGRLPRHSICVQHDARSDNVLVIVRPTGD